MPIPFDFIGWGDTVYQGWVTVDQAAVALVDTMPILLAPGRLCQNGKPAPSDQPDWKKYVAGVVEVGKLAYETSRARDFEGMKKIPDKLDAACAACHIVYRDVPPGKSRCEVVH